MSQTPPQAYISKVHLKGYKSIKDLEIDFKPGLNIIIGPNGSGKTNFLEWLDKAFSLNVENIKNVVYGKTEFYLQEKKYYLEYSVKPSKQAKEKDAQDVNISLYETENKLIHKEEYVKIGNKEIHTNTHFDMNSLFNYGFQIKGFLDLTIPNAAIQLIRFGVDKDFNDFMDSSFSIEFYSKSIDGGPFIMQSLFEIMGDRKLNEDESKLLELFVNSSFSQILDDYSPIRDIKFDLNDSRTMKGEFGNSIEEDYHKYFEVQNVKIRFLVGNTWIDWSMLSDGTKRIFYLLYSVFTSESALFFLEEPELGIHPDQLSDLMDFLKEQAKTKQIIITTHSPEVMNILNKDELDRIIVTRFDKEKGTHMHKLSPHKIKKGQIYMKKVGHLSDFWVHSNLEEVDEKD